MKSQRSLCLSCDFHFIVKLVEVVLFGLEYMWL